MIVKTNGSFAPYIQSTHLELGAGVGSRDNDGALTVFVCAIIQIKLDPFSGRCIVPIFTLIAVRT